MYKNVISLRDFYASRLGSLTQYHLGRKLLDMWPNVTGQRILGFGYATPYLTDFVETADRVIAAMPAQQGILHWPSESNNLVTLTDDDHLPFPDVFFDRIIVVHGMEFCGDTKDLLRGLWRVLADNGRLIIVTPNRRGVWSRVERTPFGSGHPYSAYQLTRLLQKNMFTPMGIEPALFFPPGQSRLLHSTVGMWENIGVRWCSQFSGVIVAEARKQIYAPTGTMIPVEKKKKRLGVTRPAEI